MKKEGDVKKEVKKVLEELGIWWTMYVPTGYGTNGTPDFVCCYQGHFIGIETKFGGRRLTALQRIQARKIEEARGVFLLIDERNVSELRQLIESACS